MDRRPLLYGLVNSDTMLRAMLAGLLVALLLLADGYVLVLLSRRLGIYLLLACAASTGLVGILVIASAHRAEIDSMRAAVGSGDYPQRQFRRLIPLATSAALLLIPGFVTDTLGVLLLVRPVGWVVGALIERRYRDRFRTLYEHLRVHH
ncbi:MAG: FxsA family protein [Spirochaetota bacterium]